MTPVEMLLEAAQQRGIHLTAEGDRLKWSGPAGAMPPDLLAELRTHKPALLAALRLADITARQRWGRPPVESIPVSFTRPTLPDRDAELLTEYIARQPQEVVQWVVEQAARYDAAFPAWEPRVSREWAAALDCLLWQWERPLDLPSNTPRPVRVRAALSLLRSLAATRNFFSPNPSQEHPS